jgi:hypothetical protein
MPLQIVGRSKRGEHVDQVAGHGEFGDGPAISPRTMRKPAAPRL